MIPSLQQNKIALVRYLILTGFALLVCTSNANLSANEPREIVFSRVDQTELKLDFYPARGSQVTPLVVWVHGGAWRRGNRASCPIKSLTDHGFAVASLDYRLTPVAKFPANVQDIKTGIGYLRSNASQLNVDPEKFVIAGASAGGHLAALVGVSNGVAELEGRQTKDQDEQPAGTHVAAIISLFGASNLETILAQSTPHGLSVREPALKLLLGDLPDQRVELAKLASPINHVDANDPPLLLVHGDQDPQMPINQAHELQGRYRKAGLPVRFDVLYGAAHGGKAFYTNERIEQMAKWLRTALE